MVGFALKTVRLYSNSPVGVSQSTRPSWRAKSSRGPQHAPLLRMLGWSSHLLFLLPKTKGGSTITPTSRASLGTPILRFAPVAPTFPCEFRDTPIRALLEPHRLEPTGFCPLRDLPGAIRSAANHPFYIPMGEPKGVSNTRNDPAWRTPRAGSQLGGCPITEAGQFLM